MYSLRHKASSLSLRSSDYCLIKAHGGVKSDHVYPNLMFEEEEEEEEEVF